MRLFWFRHIPIGLRIGIGVLLVQLLVVAWTTHNGLQVALSGLEQQKQQRIHDIGWLLNDTVAPLLAQRDYAAVEDILARIASEAEIDYLVLLGPGGEVLSRHGSWNGAPLPVPDQRLDVTDLPDDGRFDTRVAVSLFGQHYADLQLGISTRLFEQTRRDLLQRGLRNALVGLLLLSLVVAPISFCLSRRLARLTEAAEAVANGHLERRLDDPSHDELGRLAIAFNGMAQVLQGRMGQLHEAARERQRIIDDLARANRDLERISEVAAHHMREPLRRLITYAQELRRRAEEMGQEAQLAVELDVMEQQARRINALVRDTERYLSAGRPRGPVVEQSPEAVIQALQSRFADRIEATAATFELGPLPPLLIDRGRLLDLFEIALDNALGHPRPGQPLRLRIAGEHDGGHCRYRIADNGTGVSPEYRERVFTIFERLDHGGHGTGVGLAIARRIVESLGGSITLEAGIDGGTALRFDLPAGGEHG